MLAAAVLLGFLGLRVVMGFGLRSRYVLGFDDGGPLYFVAAMGIFPVTAMGCLVGWQGKRRTAIAANLIVLVAFLAYGLGMTGGS